MIDDLYVEATNYCNGKCVFCWHPEMKYPRGYADPELYTQLVKEIKPRRTWIHFAGEPCLHPNLRKIVNNCNGTAAMVTNGALLTPELGEQLIKNGITWVIFSVVSSQDRNYTRINGLKLSDVIKNMRSFKKSRDTMFSDCRITARIIFCKENQHELKAMKRLWTHYSDDIHVVPEFSVPKRDRILVGSTWKLNCYLTGKLSREAIVKWDGTVIPCCRDLDAWNPMGNVYEQSFKDIHNSPKFNKFRKSVLQDKPPDICQECFTRPSNFFKNLVRGLKQ